MASRGRSAREIQEEIDRALGRRSGGGRGGRVSRVGFILWPALWLMLGIAISLVALPLLPAQARGWVDDFQTKIVEIRDSAAGASE